jgi:hypothetical protein
MNSELVGKVCERAFANRKATPSKGKKAAALSGSYAESVIEHRAYHKKLRDDVEEILEAIDNLGLAVVDLNQYIPKRRVALTRVKKIGPAPKLEVEEIPSPQKPQSMVRLGARRRKGS